MKLAAILFLILGLVAGGCCGAYQLYQWHYLSPDLKRTLTAAMDPATTDADIKAYLHDARLQVRTKRDAVVLQKFERFVDLAQDSAEISTRLFNETLEEFRAESTRSSHIFEWADMLAEELRAPSPSLRRKIDEADKVMKEEEAKRDSAIKIRKAEEQRAKEEKTSAQELLREVRADLLLPPIAQQASSKERNTK